MSLTLCSLTPNLTKDIQYHVHTIFNVCKSPNQTLSLKQKDSQTCDSTYMTKFGIPWGVSMCGITHLLYHPRELCKSKKHATINAVIYYIAERNVINCAEAWRGVHCYGVCRGGF